MGLHQRPVYLFIETRGVRGAEPLMHFRWEGSGARAKPSNPEPLASGRGV